MIEYLFTIFIFINSVWVQGDTLDGWGSIPYPTMEICLEHKARAEKFQNKHLQINPRAYLKRFECVPQVF